MRFFILRLLAVCLLVFPVMAQALPSAGQSIRELETTPPAPPPADQAVLPDTPPASPPATPSASEETLTVREFTVSGNEAISSATLLAAVREFTGHPITLAQLQEAARRVGELYRQQGWLLARAVIPAQEVNAGVVNIQVLEGRYGEIRLQNQSRVRDALVQQLTRDLKSGDGVRIRPLERSVLLLDDLPGVQLSSALAAGKEQGLSDLAISLQPGPVVEGGVSVDNYGNSYNGAWRLNGDVAVNNPLHAGDRLSLRALVSDASQHYLRGQYELPAGPWNTRVGAAYSWMNYELGKDFEALESSGSATIASLYASQTWWRQRAYGVTTLLSYDHKKLRDETGLFSLNSEKSLDNLTLQLNGYWRDSLLGGASSSYSLAWTAGQLSLDSPYAKAQDKLLRSAGKFQKWEPTFMRQQILGNTLSLILQARGQIASGNLDSSEKISLGGAYGVRAYPEGEAPGDQGWIANLELRQVLGRQWQAGIFADAGGVTVNRHPALAAGENHRQLSGFGVAAYWQAGRHWLATVSAALPIGDEEPSSDTPRGQYFWGQLRWSF